MSGGKDPSVQYNYYRIGPGTLLGIAGAMAVGVVLAAPKASLSRSGICAAPITPQSLCVVKAFPSSVTPDVCRKV